MPGKVDCEPGNYHHLPGKRNTRLVARQAFGNDGGGLFGNLRDNIGELRLDILNLLLICRRYFSSFLLEGF